MVELISALVFCACFILATIFKAKVDAIIQEHERVTRIQITPDLYKYITSTLITVMIGSIGVGILLGVLI